MTFHAQKGQKASKNHVMYFGHASYVSRIKLLSKFSSAHVMVSRRPRRTKITRRIDEKLSRIGSLRTLGSRE